MTRRLWLLRHAKSSWDLPEGVADAARPLAGRGRSDADAVGEVFAAQGWRPDLVLCSTAERTRETWTRANRAGAQAAEVRFEAAVYGAAAAELLALLRRTPDDVGGLLLVGHAPGVPDLLAHLIRDRAVEDPETRDRLEAGYPTAGLALLDVEDAWTELDQATVAGFDIPRNRFRSLRRSTRL